MGWPNFSRGDLPVSCQGRTAYGWLAARSIVSIRSGVGGSQLMAVHGVAELRAVPPGYARS